MNDRTIAAQVGRIVDETLRAQETALAEALRREGLRPTKSVLGRIVRVKYAAPVDDPTVSLNSLLPKAEAFFSIPVVQGMFILDQGQPSEKILFYYQEPSVLSPTVKIWFPGDMDVTISENAKTSFRMIRADQTFQPLGGIQKVRRVFFVGMHNKPGLQPLDFTTWTGKVIDQIALGAPFQTIRTNLANVDFKPEDPAPYAEDWHLVHAATEGDIVFLLGAWVQKNFIRKPGPIYFDVEHPSAFSVRKNVEAYIAKIVNLCSVK